MTAPEHAGDPSVPRSGLEDIEGDFEMDVAVLDGTLANESSIIG